MQTKETLWPYLNLISAEMSEIMKKETLRNEQNRQAFCYSNTHFTKRQPKAPKQQFTNFVSP